MDMTTLHLLILAAPLAAALLNFASLFAGDRWLPWRAVQRLTVGATLVAFVAALAVFASLLVNPASQHTVLYEWLAVDGKSVRIGLLFDSLSALMAVLVTGFGFIIGRFSINYMHREQGFTRYFAAYALFVFSMLLLVLGDNYVMLFMGWEAVGVCSYLLIGQYNDRPSAARAATEAFIANRVGDAAFIVGLMVLFIEFGGVDYAYVAKQVGTVDAWAVNLVAVCLLLGAVGKSAQLPLGSWLAKAMEGPTPSSALIHAATMVTAGVYLLVRAQDLYAAAPNVMLLVALVGAATALYGALVGQTVADIKGLLATSTTTQLGLMFLACGLGAYGVAMFHLVAHAFYKSYLFLTAPSILHHLHGRLDPARTEAVAEAPSLLTTITVVSGLLVSVPLLGISFAGGALADRGPLAMWVVTGGALLAFASAAYYALQLTQHTFGSHDDGHDAHGHDDAPALPTATYSWPLLLIGAAGALGLLLQLLPAGTSGSWFAALLSPVIHAQTDQGAGGALSLRAALALVLVAMVVFAWFTAVNLGRFRAERAVQMLPIRPLYAAALNRFWLDAATQHVVVARVLILARALARFDTQVLARVAAAPGGAAQRVGHLVGWIDAQGRAAGERSPAAAALHLGRVADLLEEYVIKGIERLIDFVSSRLAAWGAGFERAFAKPMVSVGVVVAALVVAFVGAR